MSEREPVDVERINKSCQSKRRYGTEQLARDASTAAWYARKHSTRVYLCLECGGYHLTSVGAEVRMKAGYRLPRISEREKNRRVKANRRSKR